MVRQSSFLHRLNVLLMGLMVTSPELLVELNIYVGICCQPSYELALLFGVGGPHLTFQVGVATGESSADVC